MSSIAQFYTNWKKEIEDLLRPYVFINDSAIKPRFVYSQLEKYLIDFLNNTIQEQERIIILPGLRGVGKTTLLAQLYFNNVQNTKQKLDYKFYISADKLALNNISLIEFINYLESAEWGSLANSNKKILLLIDEIQYDPKWDLTLKILYDKTFNKKNLFIVATGSSAILLKKQNVDLVRRSITYNILPEKFSEFLSVHKDIPLQKDLGSNITKALFFSNSAREVFDTLKALQLPILSEIAKINKLEELKIEYFYKGALPFAAGITNTLQALQRIKDMLVLNIVSKDLKLIQEFDADTLFKIPDLLYLLANSDEVNLSKLLNTLHISSLFTLRKILNTLVQTELLYKVLPYGQPYTQVKKASKYLFIAPSIRSALVGPINFEKIKGHLLEDYCALVFAEMFKWGTKIMYDYGKIGADFIIRFQDLKEILIEVGFGKNTIKQIKQTLKKTKNRAKYSLIIGSDRLELKNDNIVTIPLDYFLLI